MPDGSRRGLRILVVEPDFEDNGAARVSIDRARRWSRAGADVTVLFVSSQYQQTRLPVPEGLQVVVASHALHSARWMLPTALTRGLKLAHAADVIIGGREIASGLLIGSLLARLARRPFAVTVHSDIERALEEFGTKRHCRNVLGCIRGADLVVPVSNGLLPGLRKLGLSADRIKVIPNGLDTELLERLALQPPAVELPKGPLVVGLGRQSREKGFDLLIRAHAAALRKGGRNHHLMLVGDGPERGCLTSLADELGVSESVTFTGFLANPYAVLARADLFVMPSRWEGFSLALAEALLLKRPTIATDCVAGPSEILEGGRYGQLVPAGHPAALADAIASHFDDPGRLQAMSVAGAETITRRFDADRAAEEHLAALRVLSGREVASAGTEHDACGLA